MPDTDRGDGKVTQASNAHGEHRGGQSATLLEGDTSVTLFPAMTWKLREGNGSDDASWSANSFFPLLAAYESVMHREQSIEQRIALADAAPRPRGDTLRGECGRSQKIRAQHSMPANALASPVVDKELVILELQADWQPPPACAFLQFLPLSIKTANQCFVEVLEQVKAAGHLTGLGGSRARCANASAPAVAADCSYLQMLFNRQTGGIWQDRGKVHGGVPFRLVLCSTEFLPSP
ncbi:MAG TPA: hypothetical protein VM008_07540 [Phycisphaerae bacterium]|nr:hypothetical protein [Phycisphaerae bacterium]